MDTYYSISCYRSTKVVWQVTKDSLSKLSRFVLDSEQYRSGNYSDSSIVIEKQYKNFPARNLALESFGTNNPDLVQQLANR